jgi:serine/threonine-protein kinase
MNSQPPIPGYEPIRPIGVNLGASYLARQAKSGVLVTLNVWPLEYAAHAEETFGHLARLHHPNILRLLEMGEFQAHFFCALEYVERTLADRLRDGPIPEVDAIRMTRAIGSAVAYALRQGMLPRGLRPTRIGLTEGGEPRLQEFCALEQFGQPQSFPVVAYMAPEWLSGTEYTGETGQVHAVGIVMYEMLTGKNPFSAESLKATVMQILHRTPESPRSVNPTVGRKINAICMKCLEKRPKDRFASLQDLLRSLEPSARPGCLRILW